MLVNLRFVAQLFLFIFIFLANQGFRIRNLKNKNKKKKNEKVSGFSPLSVSNNKLILSYFEDDDIPLWGDSSEKVKF